MNQYLRGWRIAASIMLMTLAALTLGGIALPTPDAIASDTAMPKVDLCHDYVEKGEFKRALEFCDQYLDELEAPLMQAVVYTNRGRAYLGLKKTELAEEDFTRAIMLAPKYSTPYINRASVHLDKGDYKEAIEDFDKAIEYAPTLKLDPTIAYYGRGIAMMRTGNNRHAIEDFTRAIELTPNLAPAFDKRALVEATIGNHEAAIKDFKHAASIAPQNAGYAYNVACVYAMDKDLVNACTWFELSVKKGYDRWEFIKRDETLNNLRNETCYKKIMRGK